MTKLPIPVQAERPCPEEGCGRELKITGEITIEGSYATVLTVCGNRHQVPFTWRPGDVE